MSVDSVGPIGSRDLPVACDLTALNPEQRERRAQLAEVLRPLVREVAEILHGYGLRFDSESATLARLTEFVGLERLCCAFLQFEIDVAADAGPIWLRLTGREGVREFVAGWLGEEGAN